MAATKSIRNVECNNIGRNLYTPYCACALHHLHNYKNVMTLVWYGTSVLSRKMGGNLDGTLYKAEEKNCQALM
jgi:hypothetical protein